MPPDGIGVSLAAPGRFRRSDIPDYQGSKNADKSLPRHTKILGLDLYRCHCCAAG